MNDEEFEKLLNTLFDVIYKKYGFYHQSKL